MLSTLTATILEREALVGLSVARQRRTIEPEEAKVAVPIIAMGVVLFCTLRANEAESSVAPAAMRVQVALLTAAPLVFTRTVLAVIEYDPTATLAIVATVVSDDPSAWLPSR